MDTMTTGTWKEEPSYRMGIPGVVEIEVFGKDDGEPDDPGPYLTYVTFGPLRGALEQRDFPALLRFMVEVAAPLVTAAASSSAEFSDLHPAPATTAETWQHPLTDAEHAEAAAGESANAAARLASGELDDVVACFTKGRDLSHVQAAERNSSFGAAAIGGRKRLLVDESTPLSDYPAARAWQQRQREQRAAE